MTRTAVLFVGWIVDCFEIPPVMIIIVVSFALSFTVFMIVLIMIIVIIPIANPMIPGFLMFFIMIVTKKIWGTPTAKNVDSTMKVKTFLVDIRSLLSVFAGNLRSERTFSTVYSVYWLGLCPKHFPETKRM